MFEPERNSRQVMYDLSQVQRMHGWDCVDGVIVHKENSLTKIKVGQSTSFSIVYPGAGSSLFVLFILACFSFYFLIH